MHFEPGDIVLHYRKKYKGIFKYLLTRFILFFTTDYWKNEETSWVYHAEMVFDPVNMVDVSQEWPRCKLTHFGSLNRKVVFRLVNKPNNFNQLFEQYVKETLGQKYDVVKFLAFVLDWIFRTLFFTRLLSSKHKDICSEYVARFYEERVKIPCSIKPPNSTSPDDIRDHCLGSDQFVVVINNER